MSKLFLLFGFLLMFGCTARRMYLDLTGKWSSFESHVCTAWLVSLGAIFFIIGILLGAAP